MNNTRNGKWRPVRRTMALHFLFLAATGCATYGVRNNAPWIDLGAQNNEHGVWLAGDLDGWNEAGIERGVECRHNDLTDHGRWKGHYLYFRVSNEWAFEGSRPDVWIRVEYYDGMQGQPLYLEYDAVGENASARYKRAEQITMTGSGHWRHHTYHLTDAYFGDRENDASDFRLSSQEAAVFHINRVWVFASQPAAGPASIAPGPSFVFDDHPAIIWSDEENVRCTEFRLTQQDSPDAHAVWTKFQDATARDDARVPHLRSNQTYYLWARSEIGDQWTPWTVQAFHTRYSPPPPPRISIPVDGATVGPLGLLVCWLGEKHDAYAYELEANDGTQTTLSAESAYDHCGMEALAPNTRYRLRIRLHNPRGWGEWSHPVSFATPAQSQGVDWSQLRGYSPHPYGIVSDRSYDYRPVLDRLSGRGINLIRAMPLNAWDAQPFLRADDQRYDLSRIDPEYLNRIRDFVAYANAKGFIVQLSVFEHCSLRHGEVSGRYALTKGNNSQGVDITADNFATFWSRPESPEMVFYKEWATALASVTRGYHVILEVMNEPYVNTPDNLEFHRSIIKILRDAGADKVSINSWNDACARELAPLVDYVSWHDNGFATRDAAPPPKVLQSTDTGGWHKKSDVLEWAKASVDHGYQFEHMAMSDDGDTGESDTDWAFVDALGCMN
jgi:hypothetical protein